MKKRESEFYIDRIRECEVDDFLSSEPVLPGSENPRFPQYILEKFNQNNLKWLELGPITSREIVKMSQENYHMTNTDNLNWSQEIETRIFNQGWKQGVFTGTTNEFFVEPHGIGRFVARDGAIWEGQWSEGEPYGFVRVIYYGGYYRIGQVKEGEWESY